MNKQFFHLIQNEFRNQIRLNNLVKFLLFFFLFCTFSVTLIQSHDDISEFGIVFSIMCIPLALINLSSSMFKQDSHDGMLEGLLTIFSHGQITFAKFIALFGCTIIAFMVGTPVIFLLYAPSPNLFLIFILCGIIISLGASGLTCLISAVQSYFRTNTNFLSILIMPLIIPSIILCSLTLQSASTGDLSTDSYLGLLFGINIIITPLSLYLTGFLVKNVYNV